MRPLLLIGWIGPAVVALAVAPASAQVVRCEDASGKAVYRNANDCAKGRVRGEVVQVYTPPPVVQPPLTREQSDAAINQKTNADAKTAMERDLKAFQETMRRMGPTIPAAAPAGESITPGKAGIVAPKK